MQQISPKAPARWSSDPDADEFRFSLSPNNLPTIQTPESEIGNWQFQEFSIPSESQQTVLTTSSVAKNPISDSSLHVAKQGHALINGSTFYGLMTAALAGVLGQLYFQRQLAKRQSTFEIKPQFNTFEKVNTTEDGQTIYRLRIIDAARSFSVFSVFNVDGLAVYRHSFILNMLAGLGMPVTPPYKLRRICHNSNRPDSLVPLEGDFGKLVWQGLINFIAAGTLSGKAKLIDYRCFLTSERPGPSETFVQKQRAFLIAPEDLEILKVSLDSPDKVRIICDNPKHQRRIDTLMIIAKNYFAISYTKGKEYEVMRMRRELKD